MIELFIILGGIAAERITEILFQDKYGTQRAIALPDATKANGSQIRAKNPKLKPSPGKSSDENLDFLTGILGMNDPKAMSASGKKLPVNSMSVSKDGKNVFNYQRSARRRMSGSGTGGHEKDSKEPDFLF